MRTPSTRAQEIAQRLRESIRREFVGAEEYKMPDLVPTSRNDVSAPTVGVRITALPAGDRRTSRALAKVQRRTLVRRASVVGHATVQNEKIREIDRITDTAMRGHVMLSQGAATLAQGDLFVADDLKFFSNIAKIGKGQIITDTISDFSQEGCR